MLLCMVSCSPRLTGEQEKPLYAVGDRIERFNMSIDVMRHHFDCSLIVKKHESGELRMVGTAWFGPNLFDFSFSGEEFRINYCVPMLMKKAVLKAAEKDFRTLFVDGSGKRRARTDEGGTEFRHSFMKIKIRKVE